MGEQVRSASPLSGKRELASAPCQKHFQWDYHKNSLVPAAADPSRDTFTSMNTKDIQSPLPFTRIRRVFSSQTFVLLLSPLSSFIAAAGGAAASPSFRRHCGRRRHGSGERAALGRGRMHRHGAGEGGERRQGTHARTTHENKCTNSQEHTNSISPVKARWPPTSTAPCSAPHSAPPGRASNSFLRYTYKAMPQVNNLGTVKRCNAQK